MGTTFQQLLDADFSDLTIEDVVKFSLLAFTALGFLFALNFTLNNITSPKTINVIFVLPFVMFLTPYLIISLYSLKRIEAKMQVVPRFFRDVVDNLESGTDIVTSITNSTDNEYGILNEDIKKLSNRLNWGIPFDQALLKFAENVGSKDLQRDLLLIIEARRVGGHVDKILRELSEKIATEILRISERKSNLASNTFTGYISFVIFLFIIVLVYNNLFVGLGTAMGGSQVTDEMTTTEIIQSNSTLATYLTLLNLLSFELAILSGFLFGLMQEGNLIAGAPHVVILVVVTFIAFFFFI